MSNNLEIEKIHELFDSLTKENMILASVLSNTIGYDLVDYMMKNYKPYVSPYKERILQWGLEHSIDSIIRKNIDENKFYKEGEIPLKLDKFKNVKKVYTDVETILSIPTDILPNIFQNLEFLEITHDDEYLESMTLDLKNMANLKDLYISNENIDFELNVINFPSNLESIALYKVNITHETLNEFNNCEGLKELRLYPINPIDHTKVNLNLPLEYLAITNGSYKELPKWIFNLTNLKKLVSNSGRLEIIPNEILKLKNITSISIHSNKIKVFPNILLKHPKVGNITIYRNRIEQVNPVNSVSSQNIIINNENYWRHPIKVKLKDYIDYPNITIYENY